MQFYYQILGQPLKMHFLNLAYTFERNYAAGRLCTVINSHVIKFDIFLYVCRDALVIKMLNYHRDLQHLMKTIAGQLRMSQKRPRSPVGERELEPRPQLLNPTPQCRMMPPEITMLNPPPKVKMRKRREMVRKLLDIVSQLVVMF